MGEVGVDRSSGTSGSDGFWDVSRYVGAPQCPPRCPRFASKDGRGLVARPYDDADRDTPAEMYRDYGPDARLMGLLPTDEAYITEWFPNLVDRGRNFVVVVDRDIVGHAAYVASDDLEPELAMFVHQDSHDHGIGAELCRHAAADAADVGREMFALRVVPDNQRAVHVYRGLGFETVNSDDVDTKMRLNLMSSVPSVAQPTTGTES